MKKDIQKDIQKNIIERHTQRRGITEYHELHNSCPKCGSSHIISTLMGYIYDNLETFENRNEARCGCGWRGIVHDLVENLD